MIVTSARNGSLLKVPWKVMVRRYSDRQQFQRDKTIYILGPGNIGQFIAHSLAGLRNPPPIKLLLHRDSLHSSWIAAGQKIRLRRGDNLEVRSNIKVERIHELQASPQLNGGAHVSIDHLLVTAKCTGTLSLISKIKHRLTSESTILFLQNGLGVVDEVSATLFPEEPERPHYLHGTVSHGVLQEEPFKVHHTGKGKITVGLPPSASLSNFTGLSIETGNLPPSTLHLLQTFAHAPVLNAEAVSAIDFLQAQLEKVAVNAIINPLTAILECRNGDLRLFPTLDKLISRMIVEISMVLRSLPELEHVPKVAERFSEQKLERIVYSIMASTADNESSMLRDIKLASAATEIGYITGYIITRAKELGLDCSVNHSIMDVLQAKVSLTHQRKGLHGPLLVQATQQ